MDKKLKSKNSLLTIKIWQLNLLVSVSFVFLFNHVFWIEIFNTINPRIFKDYLFAISIFALLITVINLILNLIIGQKNYKYVYSLIFILTAISFYFISQYNIVIDRDMIRNVIETNSSEAKDLFNLTFFLYLSLLSVIPIWLILRIKIKLVTFKNIVFEKVIITSISMALIITILYISYPSYASLARNNRHLSHMILPTNFIFATMSYVNEQLKVSNIPFNPISLNSNRKKENVNKNVTILIVGETARADRFGINNYSKQTNPKLSQRDIINFNQTFSCGTSTATSLPCIFSHLNRNKYNHKIGKNSDNLLDFFNRVNIDVQWRDNNTGCKGICNRVDYIDLSQKQDKELCNTTECYDEILFQGLYSQIINNENDQVIVLHPKGSHGPAYFLRYPSEFEHFKPTCKNIQLQKCKQLELDNSYDNTIVYADYIIDKAIKLLEQLPKYTSTSLIYISDHGESLGENNLYLHGTPYMIAPEAQKHIPFLIWMSETEKQMGQIDYGCLKDKQNHPYSHDNIFHSMLGFMEIKTDHYDSSLDIFNSCHKLNNPSLVNNSEN